MIEILAELAVFGVTAILVMLGYHVVMGVFIVVLVIGPPVPNNDMSRAILAPLVLLAIPTLGFWENIWDVLEPHVSRVRGGSRE